ncbi:uracil-DNA glycosylase family 4 [Rhodothalassium salexigens DSM 2132]|uniref:Type-5 uracil-DNA glycosylase n=1 Tax=Rhodothalassium salexigens DSM 2132 TaxID=1188247 RepID=A0A4R2PIF6_RHOSA|nr:uracil-DNA glycosylase [Rhodothalassium salexigens]MBB4211751.1 uracil-DNA glycosylase family 4 [Rhodothalassium salexigens DSM 2132]MBK1639616.1 uracil-DNA glycosylase [Rhodothalassium salexigens DSM 2132]TCP33951.1 uracil-DNA glycosylase family 4 [Rhodothalassium salexigens DSM 2132]
MPPPPPPRSAAAAEAPLDCALCPRLVAFRTANQAAHPDFFNAPVPSFGPETARLLVVGLAPGLKGANRTGRPFTGDYAGATLYPALVRAGLAHGTFDARPDDGLVLDDAMVTNAVRCVPPENKPIGQETNACRPFLAARIAALPRLRVILALGRIAHDNTLRALGQRLKDHPFGHGAEHDLGGCVLVDSYHCSRYNVNTGRLTETMFQTVVDRAKALLA